MLYYEGYKAWFSVLKFWIFALDFSGKIANSLVCNMWKVDTRPTSTSDF
jgi:hypothetical protein